jgi:putative spermidine/putrescine transport system ATP-binding protein
MELSGITRRFGPLIALDGVNLAIDRGEFLCMLGPSGCGKTTLLRIIAGFERPDAGEIWLRGRSLTDVPPERRELGMVFQDYALLPHLSVFDNIAFPLRAGKWIGRRRRSASLRREVSEALGLVDLVGLEDRLPSQLSGGQAQRVALARALVTRPDLVLLDEPLSALDLKVRTSMRQELRALHQQLETTFIFVTHDQDEALSMATRVALMRDGQIEQVGTSEELYRSPATRFGARFIGDQSFVRAKCQGRSNGRLLASWRGQWLEPVDRTTAQEGNDVDVMLRPEDVHLATADNESVEAQVTTVTFRGATVDIELTVGEEELRMTSSGASFAAPDARGILRVTIGRGAGVAFDADDRRSPAP